MQCFRRDELESVADLLMKKYLDAAFNRAIRNAMKYLAEPEVAEEPVLSAPPRKRPSSTKPRPTLPCAWSLAQGVLTVASASSRNTTYICTGDRCTCKTLPSLANPAGWCWHRAAWHLILTERMISDPFYFFHPLSLQPRARAYA
jgi:hypothetical protein